MNVPPIEESSIKHTADELGGLSEEDRVFEFSTEEKSALFLENLESLLEQIEDDKQEAFLTQAQRLMLSLSHGDEDKALKLAGIFMKNSAGQEALKGLVNEGLAFNGEMQEAMNKCTEAILNKADELKLQKGEKSEDIIHNMLMEQLEHVKSHNKVIEAHYDKIAPPLMAMCKNIVSQIMSKGASLSDEVVGAQAKELDELDLDKGLEETSEGPSLR
jgi:GTPase SAR1 family protein